MNDHAEDFTAEETDGRLVHWMDGRPLSVGATALSGAVAGAFLLGAIAALGLIMLSDRLPRSPRFSRRMARMLH